LFDAIREYNRIRPAYFRIPGHRYERGVSSRWTELVGGEIFKFDLTETPLLDDLHHPESAIKEAQELAAEVFGALRSFFLVNGTTCGNEAMIASTAFEGQKIAIPRNAHKSALMGLIISGARPIYVMPGLSSEFGLQGGISPQAADAVFRENPDCKGLMVVSPTYYGICSDIRGLSESCHRHGAALIVDEAHGAHMYFSERLPDGALAQGADMCAQSIHKVTGSLTQSSMLHIGSGLVDGDRVEATLHIVQSTSPSYLLMTSLDLARRELALNGRGLIANAVDLALYARNAIDGIDGIACAGEGITGTAGIAGMDTTRLVISAGRIGLTGFELKRILYEGYGVDLELSDHANALAIVTFANTREDIDRLIAALRDIGEKRGGGPPIGDGTPLPPIPPYALSPREAYFASKRIIPWQDARGKVASEMIAPYPPGIPVIYPGEIVSDEVWEYVEAFRLRKGHLHGPADGGLDSYKVIDA
jgi:arginine/lysine/ornithine decarboxylase